MLHGQLPDSDAGGIEDGVRDRRDGRRQRRFTQPRGIIVAEHKLHLDIGRRLRNARRLLFGEVVLDDAAILDGDLPVHHVAHTFDKTAFHQVARPAGVDDLAADIDG